MTLLGERRATAPRGDVRISDAANATGVSPSALRLWERQGLVEPARDSAGHRRYGPADLQRLRTIRGLRRREGLNAPAIRRVLDRGRADRHASAPIAPRLRSLRATAGLTLREAAARSDLSTSFISALERGLTGASIAVLRRLVAAYGSTLGLLLGSRDHASGRLVPAAGRRVLDTGTGVRIEDLANGPLALESHLFILAPGASSQGGYSHQGEEFMYLLSGSLAVWLDASDEYYELSAGDALTFPSTLAHRFQALGTDETRLIWINTPPTF